MTITQVKIILVEPSGELNIGSIARVMKNMGLRQLVIVNPQCNHLSEDAQLMAVHGFDVLKNAKIVPSLPVALEECYRAIATTARNRSIPTELETPKESISWLLEDERESALIFGSEERGLSNEELNYAQRFITIPSNPAYPSLNLAQAVAICVYELYQASLDTTIKKEVQKDSVTLDELEGYYEHLESVLLKINFLYPHTTSSRMEKLRRIFNRNDLQKSELAMLRGMLRQMEWFLKD